MRRGVLTKADMWTWTHTQREGHVEVEAETGVMLPRAGQRQGLLAQQRQGGGVGQVLPHSPRRQQTCWYHGLGLPASRSEREHILLFKPPRVGCLVMATLGV